ncbi:hypothetical protein TNCV_925971 [Trichonephila clavipes]|nr:hypothetical protein TNCV_925971 [Trichonephila clavipes]
MKVRLGTMTKEDNLTGIDDNEVSNADLIVTASYGNGHCFLTGSLISTLKMHDNARRKRYFSETLSRFKSHLIKRGERFCDHPPLIYGERKGMGGVMSFAKLEGR